MNNEQKILIGVCGFGSTGSGAVMDYLREFDDVSAGRNMELSFLYDPSGVLDLEQALVTTPIRFYSSDAAIKEFIKIIYSIDLKRYVKKYMSIDKFYHICEEYIDGIAKERFEGCLWHYDRRKESVLGYFIKYRLGHKFLRIYDKLGKKQPESFFNTCMYLGVHDEKFYRETRKFTAALLEEMCGNHNIIAIDQPFPSNNPELCFHFFDRKCKAIIVNRDPRDLFILSMKNARGWEMRFTPTHRVEDFISYYKDQMEIIKCNSEDVLYVQFEDLIYDYDKTTKTIDKFLGLKNHSHPKKYFDPSVSIANTQLILRYPEERKNIEKIETELSEYLYQFDESRADLSVKPWAFEPGDN